MQKIKPVLEWASDYWSLLAIGIALFAIGIVQRVRHIGKENNSRDLLVEGITMTIEGRRMHVHKVMLNKVCDAVLEAVITGDITEQEANDELGKLAKIYDPSVLENLIKTRKPAMLKAELRNRKRRRQTRNEKTVRLPIPEPKKITTAPVDPDSLAAILGGR